MSVLFKKVSLETLEEMQKTLLNAIPEYVSEDEALSEEGELGLDDLRDACVELEQPSDDDLPVSSDDGAVYSMLFDFLEAEVCGELRLGGQYSQLMEFWQEDSDMSDLILLTPEIIKPLRACFSSLDFDIPTFIEDFAYEYDCEEGAVSAVLQTIMSAMMASAGEAILFVAE